MNGSVGQILVRVEAAVLPAERCDMGRELIRQMLATGAALSNGSTEILCCTG